MSLLLETSYGDVVIDLDTEGSPALCCNVLKLAKARYYTNTLIYNVDAGGRYCQAGDPRGDGTGGACIHAVMEGGDVEKSKHRFLKRQRLLTKDECMEKGRVVAVEMNLRDTIGSQFLITLSQGALSESLEEKYPSLGIVVEDDDNVLDKIKNAYCDVNGRPHADIRVSRALVIHDPYPDPPGMEQLLKERGVLVEDNVVTKSPLYDRPPEEVVPHRIQASEVSSGDEKDENLQQEEMRKKETKSRAVVLEMLGDLPSAEIKAPDNVLFVCKLNSVTDDEDLQLIFSRFDPNCKAEIIRDSETGASLQYAFVEFSNKQQCVEAYFKMNNALVDDRRIKVDFSQSVAKVWDKYAQRMRTNNNNNNNKVGQHGGGGNRNDGYRQERKQPASRGEAYQGRQRFDHENRGGRRDVGGDRDFNSARNSRWEPPPPRGNNHNGRGERNAHHGVDDDGDPRRHHHRHDERYGRDDHYGRRRTSRSSSDSTGRSHSPRRRKKHHKKHHRRHRDDDSEDDRHHHRRHKHKRHKKHRRHHDDDRRHDRKRQSRSSSRSRSRD